MQMLRMQRSITVVTAIGFILLGGISHVLAAEETKKPTEQTAPAGKTPTVKKGSANQKATVKGGTQKSKSAPGEKPSTQSPKYTSAEKAANAKACYGETPKIDSMVPDEGKAGEKVMISGKNFGPAECLRSVSFGPGYPATFKLDSPTQITATVPSGRRSGLAMLTVTTASGEDSRVFALK